MVPSTATRPDLLPKDSPSALASILTKPSPPLPNSLPFDAIGALEDMHIQLMDITTAFLNGDVDFDIYVDQPDGFQQGDLVCKLKRCMG
jgi:hypothetical protein